MIRRCLMLSPLVLACLFSAQTVHASPVSSFTSVHAMFAKSKTVKLELHNTSSSPMELRAGEKTITVGAGQTVTLNLPLGTRILTNTATDKHPAGTLIVEVNSALNGTTINLT